MSGSESKRRAVGERRAEIQRLYRSRPRSRFLRFSLAAALALVVVSWAGEGMGAGDFLSERRLANLERFASELVPYPLQGQDFELPKALSFYAELLRSKGFEAALSTLAISILAIVLAAAGGLLLGPLTVRTLAAPEPYAPSSRPPSPLRRAAWRGLRVAVRAVLILSRSIPEYVWAFLFVAVLGPTAWPLILALAAHNLGILGKLKAEVVEDLEPQVLRGLRGLGATRLQMLVTAIFPLSVGRFLLFFFYRWETCVREATVLGMLGIASLGFCILEARARNHYDEMFFYVLLGAVIVLVGDAVSAVSRGAVRRAG